MKKVIFKRVIIAHPIAHDIFHAMYKANIVVTIRISTSNIFSCVVSCPLSPLNFRVQEMKLKYLEETEDQPTKESLKELGVLYFPFPPEAWEKPLQAITEERGYKNRDEVFISKDTSHSPEQRKWYTDKQTVLTSDNPAYNLNEKLDNFFQEHLHDDEEIRFIIDGEGRFDVRDKKDRWLAITVEKGDLIIVPAGLYHRFCLGDNSKFIHAMRLFQDAPKWTPIYRKSSS